MITTAWQLGGGQLTPGPHPAVQVGPHARLRRPLPHQIPPLLRHLRPCSAAPAPTTADSSHPGGERDPWGRPLDEHVVLVLHTWTYAGTGYTTTPGAELALASAACPRPPPGRQRHLILTARL